MWFTPNPPRTAFKIEVDSLEMAVVVDTVLTRYSLYLGDDLIPVSAGGIEEWSVEEADWYDADIDEDVLHEMRAIIARGVVTD